MFESNCSQNRGKHGKPDTIYIKSNHAILVSKKIEMKVQIKTKN
jgi:hypothetical protein